MRVVSAMEHRAHLCEILNSASAGERIIIERGRRPLAVLVSPEDASRLEESAAERAARRRAALDRLEAFSERMAVAHPESIEAPDSATLIRNERDRGHGDAE
jgi:prevent-host-death family protein